MISTTQLALRSVVRQLSATTSRDFVSSKNNTKKETAASPRPPGQDVWAEERLGPNFLVRHVGSHFRRWADILEKHPELTDVKRKDLINTTETLKALNYDTDDIMLKPMILYTNSLTISNRHKVLAECGIEAISISLLSKYVAVMNKSVTLLKARGYIPYSLDVIQNLSSCFTEFELPADGVCNEDMSLKRIREHLLNCFLRQSLGMDDKDIEKLWKVYARVRHRSFKSVQTIINLLINELHFPKERITKNAYLLYADPDNVKRILQEIPTIDGLCIREIVYKRPKILMSTCDALKMTLQHIKAFGIGEGALMRCLEVLTLGPDTILERLRDLNEIEEFQVLGTNPRIMRLVHYQNKARIRLEYLNQLKVRCASLHILSCGSDAFAKFARDGSDRTKGRDIVVFLANILEQDENCIRSLLIRHPNWCHIPVVHVKQCYDFLIKKKFSNADIYQNIHLLLYPIKRIEEKLLLLRTPDFFDELQLCKSIDELTDSEVLTLLLYLIECEFHFTGDGIWTEQHTHLVENFNNLLPDFPAGLNKVYKYGVKPATPNTGKIELRQ